MSSENQNLDDAIADYMKGKGFVDKKGNKPWYERPWIREIRLGTVVAFTIAAWTWWHTGEWNPLSEPAKPAVQQLTQAYDFSEFQVWHRTETKVALPNPIFWDKLPPAKPDEYRVWTKAPDGFWYFMRKTGDPAKDELVR